MNTNPTFALKEHCFRYGDLEVIKHAKFISGMIFFLKKNSPYHKLIHYELTLCQKLPEEHYKTLSLFCSVGANLWGNQTEIIPGKCLTNVAK